MILFGLIKTEEAVIIAVIALSIKDTKAGFIIGICKFLI